MAPETGVCIKKIYLINLIGERREMASIRGIRCMPRLDIGRVKMFYENIFPKYVFICLFVFLFFVENPANAGIVEKVQTVVKSICKKDIDADVALRLVGKLYVTCQMGELVTIEEGCRVRCLRSDSELSKEKGK